MEQSKEQSIGILYAISAYLIWGVLPLYWKLMEQVPAEEVLAHRIIWSLVLMVIILVVSSKVKSIVLECKKILSERKQTISILLASILISINWFVYIWAVNNDRIIETSLGYYINPLVTVLLGILVLREKLSFWQFVAVILATVGVFNMVLQLGSIPWVSLILASSFAFYGLFKKVANLGSLTGLTIETLLITPIALLYIVVLSANGNSSLQVESPSLLFLLIGSGVATAVPLLLFASSARRIRLSLIGFFQYIAPSITLIIGIFIFHEPFTFAHLSSFAFIWVALAIFSVANTKFFIRLQPKLFTKDKSLQG